MTLDQIDRMVRQANPVLDLTTVKPAPVLEQRRRTDMQTQDSVETQQESEGPRRGQFLAIAAAAAVILGLLFALGPGDDVGVADQPADSPAEIAARFLEARWTGDIDTAVSYLAPSALDALGGTETMRLSSRSDQAQGFKRLVDSCEDTGESPAGTPGGTIVVCPYDYHGIRSEELGRGPFTGSTILLTILEDKIVGVDDNIVFMENGFSKQIWEPFADWVAENYPGDVTTIYTDGSRTMFQMTEEGIDLLEQRSREWAEVGGPESATVTLATAFVEAFASFDRDAVASYLAADADMSTFEWDGGDWRLANRLLEAQGFKLRLTGCDDVATANNSSIVRCDFDFHALRSDEIGLGPYIGSSFSVTVSGDEVTRASMPLYTDQFSSEMWEPFAAWLAETHPEDVEIMYTSPGQSLERLTEESIALWEQRIREYVEVVGG